ncbi:hypothetical protein [uncultured Holdemanella sp.]|uniref:hypothetical protein n=1 Tax=uncultured Holdemanella sp. TaxID=1763549 RepID=UPI0025E13E61|nr:hypothetical protein [uncultured Holdemanella sp.]
MISRRRIIGFAIGKMLRQDGWAEKYNPKNQFRVNQYDYMSCKEYVAALREKWQEYEDPECEFEEYVDVNKYSNYDDYAYDVDVYRTRLEWRDEMDCDCEFDVNPCDFEYKEYYVKTLKRAWKKELDPYDEFEYIDLEFIDDVYDYKERIDECREWKDEHDSNDEYNVDPSEYEDEDEYLDALRKLWKEKHDYFNEFDSINPRNYSSESDYSKAIENKKNWMNKYDKNNAYKLDPSSYDNEEDYLDDLRCCWQHKYDPDKRTIISVNDYDTEEEYRESLVNNWQERYDPQHRFNSFQFERFTTVDDYLVELNNRIDWINKCDPEGIFSKIDPSKYDNMFQYQHDLDLRKAWKNKYDPDNIHNEIDPCDYSSVEEYHKALMND